MQRALKPGLRFLYSLSITAALGTGSVIGQAPMVMAVPIQASDIPSIDGQPDESIWQSAHLIAEFFQRDPSEGEPASERTEVRILYSEEHLYIGLTCFDSEPSHIRATELRRDDPLENDDRFTLLLDTFQDRRNAYLFRINPRGTKFDAQITDEKRQLNSDWDEKWTAAGHMTNEGWTAEMAIPFRSLRSSGDQIQDWGLNLERIIVRKNEEVYWSGHSRDYEFWNVSQAGTLSHLEGVKTGLRLRIKPYGLAGVSQFPKDGNGSQTTWENESAGGLEIVKASLTSSITADFTVNPDFAQAEVDDARFNLTRFSLFFPERREFFLERAGIFDFGTPRPEFGDRPPEVLGFFSRRIGLEGSEPIPIRIGSRVTGDTGGFQFGFLNVFTGKKTGIFNGDTSTVLRVKRKLLDRSFVGAIFTDRRIHDTSDFNRLAGIDANFVLFDKLSILGFYSETRDEQRNRDNTSYFTTLKWRSDAFDFEAERLKVDEHFDPELGFVLREDVIKHKTEATWKPRPRDNRWIRQFRISSEHSWYTSQQDYLASRQNDIFFGATLHTGDFLGIGFNSKHETLVEDFEIHPDVTIPLGSYDFHDISVFTRFYQGRWISGQFRMEVGTFFGGDIVSGSATPLIKINEKLSTEIGYSFTQADLPWGSFSARTVNARLSYNLTNRLLTSTTLQYDNVEKELRLNWRLNYIYRPGDDLFIVFNQGSDFTRGLPQGLINRTILVKFTHSFDW